MGEVIGVVEVVGEAEAVVVVKEVGFTDPLGLLTIARHTSQTGLSTMKRPKKGMTKRMLFITAPYKAFLTKLRKLRMTSDLTCSSKKTMRVMSS